ncbi:acylphosphatase [Phycicoccus sp. BSK3Z-2]|uniref:Acylphosphatase n=1 Tax=Phycicoccus avicenniae TaxID=2828860 RepID=A0A941D975_9MICO|nr:acylphosphatase [Phycicoccus avicenniae]MBR7742802.1 acylphosphatase [Phycicoccus avicenniae]
MTSSPEKISRGAVFVRGTVQGVGFRWWTRSRALELGLAGFARNTTDGRVEVVAEGRRESVERLHELLREDPSSARRPGSVASVSAPRWEEPRGESGFVER